MTATTVTNQAVKFQATTLKNDKDFGKALTKAREGVQAAFTLIQDCILYGLDKYQHNSADSSYLSRAMDICNQMPGTNPNQVKAYIQEHANCLLRKVEDGSFKFKKTGKGPAVVTMPEEGYNWWNQKTEANTLRVDMIDPVKELRNLFKRITEKEAKGLLPESRKELFHELLAQLKPVLEMEPLPSAQLHSIKPEDMPAAPVVEQQAAPKAA